MSTAENISVPDVVHMPVVVQRILFSNSDNGYCVVKVYDSTNSHNEFVAVGLLGEVQEKDSFKISGSWVTNQYGRQLQISDMVVPELNNAGILEFLKDGQIKGIGPKTAELIYKKFGDNLLSVFENTPEKLISIKGISEKKLQGIMQSWKSIAGKRQTMIELRGMGLAFGVINKLLKKYEQNPRIAIQRIKEDPYFLAWEIKGIGFLEADAVARKLGFSEDCVERFHAAIGYSLKLGMDEGHCFLTDFEVLDSLKNEKRFRGFQNISFDDVRREGKVLNSDRKIIFVEDKLYLPSLFKSEKGLAYHLDRILYSRCEVSKRFNEYVDDFKAKNNIVFHPLQDEAIQVAGTSSISVITGGPGTGKTTLIKGLIHALKGKKISLCAPTGRAAKRMAESSGIPAQTIHRLLGFNPAEGFAYNDEHQLDSDVIIMDEASMLDVHLAYALFQAIPSVAQLILVGDIDQLPPVGAGQVFSDVIKSNRFPVVKLEQIYRQSEKSFISVNAQSIRNGNLKGIHMTKDKDTDFHWWGLDEKLSPEVRQNLARNYIFASIKRLFDLQYSLDDILVLSPMRRGPIGVEILNTEIQAIYNPHGKIVHKGMRNIFKIGDKVMQIRNNYDTMIFNGDMGIVTKGLDGGFAVNFDGCEVEYEGEAIKELQLAYAMTIHKSQGSENKVVVQVVSKAHYIMLNRALLYTGVTRAREKCILIGEYTALARAVSNNEIKKRNTSFEPMFSELVLRHSMGSNN